MAEAAFSSNLPLANVRKPIEEPRIGEVCKQDKV
jgi:hypothetical protein